MFLTGAAVAVAQCSISLETLMDSGRCGAKSLAAVLMGLGQFRVDYCKVSFVGFLWGASRVLMRFSKGFSGDSHGLYRAFI